MLYKYLDCPKSVMEEVKNFGISKKSYSRNLLCKIEADEILQACPDLKEWFASHSLEIDTAYLIMYRLDEAQGSSAIHTDTDYDRLAMNFPVENTENSFTAIYEVVDGEPIKMELKNGIKFTSYNNTTLKELGRYEFSDRPVLFNVRLPHAVHFESLKVRSTFSFRFKNNPWHLFK